MTDAARERRRRGVRRQRIGLGIVAAVAAVAGALAGSGGDDPAGRGPQTSSRPACPPRIAADPRRLVGQMLVVRLEATATPELQRAARRGEIGGVIAFPPPGTPPAALEGAVGRLQRAARAGGNPALLVATDQEGGDVRRLPGPPDRTPAELGIAGPAAAAAEGSATGRYLRSAGVNVDLAPVLDVASGPDAFVAARTFGVEAGRVAATGTAFVEGLQRARVAATAKHFPGLGLATINTDLAPSAIEATRSQLAPGLEPFRAAIDAGVGLVMVGHAVYPALDPGRPAAVSRPIVTGLLRERLGYRGVVITDDLLAGALEATGVDAGEAAVEAARAGSDLLLFARAAAPEALPALVAAVRRERLDSARLVDSCARILALKRRYAP